MTTAEPGFFGPGDRPLFGWLHRPARGAPRPIGVVLCGPFGYEAVCAHRGLRNLADAICAAGYAALRFDRACTGDSSGDPLATDAAEEWLENIGCAASMLRAQTSCRQIVFLGLRLGGLLAAEAARRLQCAEGLILIATDTQGRRFLREARALELARARPSPQPDELEPEGVQRSAGFALGPATQRTLQGIDLMQFERAPARHVLILERDDLTPGAQREALWQSWRERGAAIGLGTVGGYVNMTLDAHAASLPPSLAPSCLRWLKTIEAPGEPVKPPAPETLEAGGLQLTASIDGVRETALRIAGDAPLFGILSEPADIDAVRPRRALLLLNAGAVLHIGPNRLYTDLARRWAKRGMLVLRLDLSGLGDSPARPGERENVVYSERALDDVAAALEFLRNRTAATRIAIAGLCSGAYHAFKAAAIGLPVDQIVAINPLTFFWRPGMTLDIPGYAVEGEVSRYRKRILDREAWLKLLRGEVSLRNATQIAAQWASHRSAGFARELARATGLPLQDDLAAELGAVARRGVMVNFVFAEGDPGLALLRVQGGRTVGRLERAGKLTIDLIPKADHTLTTMRAQRLATELLDHRLLGLQSASADGHAVEH